MISIGATEINRIYYEYTGLVKALAYLLQLFTLAQHRKNSLLASY